MKRIPKTVTLSVETFFLKLLPCELSFSACFKRSMGSPSRHCWQLTTLPLQQAEHHTPAQEGFVRHGHHSLPQCFWSLSLGQRQS